MLQSRLVIATIIFLFLLSHSYSQQSRSFSKHSTNAGTVTLTITDDTLSSRPSISFGVNPNATDCIDEALGEFENPPMPPSGVMALRFIDLHGSCLGQGTTLNLHRYHSPSQVDTYRIKFQPGSWGSMLTFSWTNVTSLYTGSVRLKDRLGSIVDVDMRAESTARINADDIATLYIIATGPLTTFQPPPVVTTHAATNVTTSGALLSATINPNGSATEAYFEWGATTAYGSSTPKIQLSAASLPVTITHTLDELDPGHLYHFRAVAVNAGGTGYGWDQSFTTPRDSMSKGLRIPFKMESPSGRKQTIYFGVHPNATYCIDEELGEREIPRGAPLGIFDMRFVDSRFGAGACLGHGLFENFHPPRATVDTFRVSINWEYEPSPLTFSWPDLSTFFAGPVRLAIPGGSSIDMKSQQQFVLSDQEVFHFRIITSDPILTDSRPPALFRGNVSDITPAHAEFQCLLRTYGVPTTVTAKWWPAENPGNVSGYSFSSDEMWDPAPLTVMMHSLSENTRYVVKLVAENSRGTGEVTVQFTTRSFASGSHLVIPLTVSDSMGHSVNLRFGVHSEATYCIDPHLGEQDFPPARYQFDARFVDSRTGSGACLGVGVLLDLRSYSNAAQIDTYKVKFQPSAFGYPIIFSWPDLSGKYSGPVSLIGSGILVDMKSMSSFAVENTDVTSLRIIAQGPLVTNANETPVARTLRATEITSSSARLNGLLETHGLPTEAFFEWWTVSGETWISPVFYVHGSDSIVHLSTLAEGLQENTTYYYRLTASNENGTSTGDIVPFTTQFEPMPGRVKIPLTVSDPAGQLRTIEFGVHPEATYCIDNELGEFEFPPVPPVGVFDVRFVDVRAGSGACMGQGLTPDIRPFFSSTQIDTYKIAVQAGDSGYPITFRWPDLSARYKGRVRMIAPLNASMVDVDMKTQNSASIESDDIARLYILAEGPVGESVTGQSFTEVDSLPGVFHGSASWGDYDSDGDLDLLVAGIRSSETRVATLYRNDNGSFVDTHTPLVGVNHNHSWVWGDYDADGDLDLLLNGGTNVDNSDPVAKLYRNDGGSFAEVQTSLPAGVGTSQWVDFDNDNDLDLFVGGSPDNGSTFFSRLLRNDGGTFGETGIHFPGVWASALNWGDYDNDGDKDLLLSGYGNEGVTTRIYRNEESTFSSMDAPLVLMNSAAVAWVDFDGDLDLDIVASGDMIGEVDASMAIYRNDHGVFTQIQTRVHGVSESAISMADYDGDGDIDMILSGRTARKSPLTKVYRNDNGRYVDSGHEFVNVWFGSVSWGDYDNDGDPDLALTGWKYSNLPSDSAGDGAVTMIYRNDRGSNVFGSQAPPEVPSNLFSHSAWEGVRLAWDLTVRPDSGSHRMDFLTYNVRVGSTPGGSDVIAPSADLESGRRHIPAMGNAQSNHELLLAHLSPGTYYWSVQAIDQSYRASVFAPEASFTVREPQVDSNLVAHWTFDEVSGPLVADRSPNKFDGTAVGTSIVAGVRGNARRFDGVDDYVQIGFPEPNALDFQVGESFSIDAWFRSSAGGIQEIVRRGTASGPGYFLRLNDGRVEGGVGDFEQGSPPHGIVRVTSENMTLNDGQWHHARMVRDQVRKALLLFVDNSLAARPKPDDFGFPLVAYRDLEIGRWGGAGGVEYFNGDLDEIRLARWSMKDTLEEHEPAGESPLLYAVHDIPNDEGGFVTLRWAASTLDTNLASIDHYSIWRSTPRTASYECPPNPPTDSSRCRTTVFDDRPFAWEWIADMPAHKFRQYSYTAATLYNTTPWFDGKHYFLVSAHTPDPNVFYDSNPDSGFSVDNIAPRPPESVRLDVERGHIVLVWAEPREKDIRHYAIYRDTIPNVRPSELTFLAYATENRYVDDNIHGTQYYYRVVAIDMSGNASGYSVEVGLRINEVPDGSTSPERFALAQNWPNPFNPSTTIAFSVREEAHVTIAVYDVLGREVERLSDGRRSAGTFLATWDAVDRPSGVYVCRMTAVPIDGAGEPYRETRRMLLVR